MPGPKRAGKYRLYCNLGYNLTEAAVGAYFQQLCTYGRVLDVYIPRHSSGRNKGYGFTTFESEEDLNSALLNPEHLVQGTLVKVNRAGPRPEFKGPKTEVSQLATQPISGQPQGQHPAGTLHGRGPRLYVGGIPDEVTEEHVKTHFSRWGKVLDIYFPGKKGQKRVNYVFVTFDNYRSAQLACSQSERSIYGKPVQSISMAEERTIDSAQDTKQLLEMLLQRKAGASALLPSDSWAQDYRNLGLLTALQQSAGMANIPTAITQNCQALHGQQYEEQMLMQSLANLQGLPNQGLLQQAQANLQVLHSQPGVYSLPPASLEDMQAGIQNLSLTSAPFPIGMANLSGGMSVPAAFAAGGLADYMPTQPVSEAHEALLASQLQRHLLASAQAHSSSQALQLPSLEGGFHPS